MTFDNQTQKLKYIAGIKELLQLFYGDTEHMSAFGMTRDERREKLKFQSKGAAIDWDIYDIPTIHRQ